MIDGPAGLVVQGRRGDLIEMNFRFGSRGTKERFCSGVLSKISSPSRQKRKGRTN